MNRRHDRKYSIDTVQKLCEKDCKKERRNSTDGSVVHFLNRNDPHWRTANTTKDTSVLNPHRLLRRSNPAYRGVNFTGKRQVSVALPLDIHLNFWGIFITYKDAKKENYHGKNNK